jgi:hypothetical protein
LAVDRLQTSDEDPAVLRPASDIIARNLGESAVLIRLQTNKIYELNATGARIWDLLKAGSTQEQLVDALMDEFSVNRDDLSRAVGDLLNSLRADGLI